MPSSPLAAAMLSGQNAGLLSMDPTALAVQPELQVAQGLQQQGDSTAPAYPAQALARVFQAGVGASLQHDALNQLMQSYSGSAEALQKVFPSGTPLGDALRNPNPLVRMMAMQQAPKAMVLGYEPSNLGPDTTRVSGSNVVATGSPALAGATAGAQAAARSPFEAGGEGVVQTPTGPQKIPITAATRAGMQPGASSPTPAVAVPPPEPRQPGPNDRPTILQPSAGPGTPAVSGEPLGNTAIEPAVKADTEELAKDREKAIAGQADMANVRAIQDFLPKVKTGWGAETKLEGARILKGLGVSDEQIQDFLKTDVASGQILQKKFVELSAAAARTMGAREPGSVISMFSKAYPNLGTDPQAVSLQTNALYMDRLRAQHLAEQKTGYLNDSINGVQSTGKYRGLTGFNEQFNKTNPAEYYLHAAESMSGRGEPWARIKDPNQQQQIINLIPSGSQFMGPDGRMYVKP